MDLLVHRKFGYCKIKWEIKNICVTACRENWEIVSPEFHVRGLHLTKWRMVLKSETEEEEEPLILFNLERLKCGKSSEKVCVSFLLRIDTPEKTFLEDLPIFETYFGKNSSYSVELDYERDILGAIFLFRPDVVHLRCELLVYFEGVEETFDTCRDSRLKQLSQDLLALYQDGYAHDVILQVHDRNIRAHKSILLSRSGFFFLKINENPERAVIDMGIVHDFEAFTKVMTFLYTGNPDCILRKPSISISQFADKLGLDDAIQCYAPDELTIRSTVGADEFCFKWTIQNFLFRCEYCLESPLLTMEKTGITWKLKLYPVYFLNDVEYVAVFAEFTGGNRSNGICVEFTLIDEDSYSERVLRTTSGENISIYRKFIRRESLLKYLQAKDLTILYRLRVSTGVQDSSIVVSQASSVYSRQRHYNYLLTSLAFLYYESFGDTIIRSKRERFKVCKCILKVRSPNIYDMLAGKNYLFLDIESGVLDEIFHFLYTATFKDANPSARLIFEIYKAAEKFNINCLKTMCSEFLQRNTSRKR